MAQINGNPLRYGGSDVIAPVISGVLRREKYRGDEQHQPCASLGAGQGEACHWDICGTEDTERVTW